MDHFSADKSVRNLCFVAPKDEPPPSLQDNVPPRSPTPPSNKKEDKGSKPSKRKDVPQVSPARRRTSKRTRTNPTTSPPDSISSVSMSEAQPGSLNHSPASSISSNNTFDALFASTPCTYDYIAILIVTHSLIESPSPREALRPLKYRSLQRLLSSSRCRG